MSTPKSSSFFGSTQTTNGCVMVVEDDPNIRNHVSKLLEKKGYDVIEVENGTKAIETIGSGENPLVVDVVIADIDKPKGMEAINFLKKEYPRVSVIALTGLEEKLKTTQVETKVVILGAGKGGSAFLDLLNHLPEVEIVGIADKVASAPGLISARQLGVPVWDNIIELIAQEDVNLIVDVTGNPEMAQIIEKHKSDTAEILSGTASKLLWDVVRYESQMQSHVLQTEKMSNLMKAGMIFDYLIKPVKEDKINSVIIQAMDHREIAKL
ncbi:response regulator [Candidatus Nitronereus thalassa]|uniref:Response regulator n=1 Tax=Candidatus Nitronereus thalassa TaxID=3020898 RepID=A0ABU3KDX6_9BACT|nr:response regulator [Candidatus Nitronereus thalassa]MDT7044277.1 response regulator [Candidatus Nitronereus thalassa]